MEGFDYFSTLRLPEIVSGPGTVAELPAAIRRFGRRALVVVRQPGFTRSEDWARIEASLSAAGVEFEVEGVAGEPSPALVDEIVARVRGRGQARGPVEVVVGIGGGSVLDTAKAVAGLLIPGDSVMDHLEGIGPGLPYHGPAVPFVAVPTTAGTGSEATKNAVLSVRGAGGFKRSFRDEALIARVAILDPELLRSCPPELIAANGMDALTQLLESYLSTRANPVSDALALRGLAAARDGLLAWHEMAVAGLGEAAASDGARAAMASAALCSGICLAQTGLGAVHGVASPLGALFPIPHGVACGATLAAATRVNVAALEQREPGNVALVRYAELGRLLTGSDAVALPDERTARAALVNLLEDWRACLAVPRLSAFGIAAADIPAIVADSRGSSMKTNPIVLTDDEIGAILQASL
ncbi:MAG: iron-containing alcohol dehydrogenase [Candidatus Limnocylindrales bacterium]|jgi:alcohol dehydrogenase